MLRTDQTFFNRITHTDTSVPERLNNPRVDGIITSTCGRISRMRSRPVGDTIETKIPPVSKHLLYARNTCSESCLRVNGGFITTRSYNSESSSVKSPNFSFTGVSLYFFSAAFTALLSISIPLIVAALALKQASIKAPPSPLSLQEYRMPVMLSVHQLRCRN